MEGLTHDQVERVDVGKRTLLCDTDDDEVTVRAEKREVGVERHVGGV
jgi:hypothetical protein